MRVEEKNKYNESKWGKIVDVYKDEAKSGKDTNRPEYQRMLSDVSAGKIDTIMVTELSRINRSVVDFLAFMKFCRDNNADFICLQYDFDTTTPMGKMLITIMAALYEFEREQTIERIKNNYYVRLLRGLLNGGCPISGYDPDPKQMGSRIVNLIEAEKVKQIFELYAINNKSMGDILRILDVEKTTNKQWITKSGQVRGGGNFNRTTLCTLLSNYSYIALKEINPENKNKNREELKEDERYQLVPAPWEPIISEELFNAAQEKLKINRDIQRTRNERNYDFILTGILYCDECGSPLMGETGHGASEDHYYYGHSRTKGLTCRVKRYSAPKLEFRVMEQLSPLLSDTDNLDGFLKRFNETLDSSMKNVESLINQTKREIEELETKKRNFLFVIGNNPEASQVKSILTEIQRIEEKITELESKREDLKIKRLNHSSQTADKDHIVKNLKGFCSKGFEKIALSEKRLVLHKLFKSIHIHPDNVICLNVWTKEHRLNHQLAKATEKNITQTLVEGAEGIVPFVQTGMILPFPARGKYAKNGNGSAETSGAEPNFASTTSREDVVVCSPNEKIGRADWL